MSELDNKTLLEAIYKSVSLNKLKEIPKDSTNWFKATEHGDIYEFVIEAEPIKQAFIDAGWEPPIVYNKPPKNRFGEPIPMGELKPMTGGFEYEKSNATPKVSVTFHSVKDDLSGGSTQSFQVGVGESIKLENPLETNITEVVVDSILDDGLGLSQDKSWRRDCIGNHPEDNVVSGDNVKQQTSTPAPLYLYQHGESNSFTFAGDMNALKDANGFMTGQECYDKFVREYDILAANNTCGELEYHKDDVIDAAKRAAGIE